jgi:hypothetical protein
MRDRGLVWWLLIVTCAAIAGFAAVLLTRDPTGQNALMLELGKGLLQLVVIGVLGTVLKLLADAHQAKRLRAEQRAEFWRNKYYRLVEATNKLRRVPLVLPVDPEPTNLQQHMLTVLEVAAELRVIKHEISVTAGVRDSPIADFKKVTKPLEDMYAYADALAVEFEKALSRHRASDDDHSAWETLRHLDTVKDLLTTGGLGGAAGASTWPVYLKLETHVLRLITAATLGESLPDGDEELIATPSSFTPVIASQPLA